jgi:dihydrolipoamide dehydrogenase
VADKSFDIAVIGAGPAGYACAIRAAQLGMSVVLVEESDSLGGTCLNIGCIPAKALLDSTERYADMKNHSAEHGIVYDNLRFDLDAMMKRKSAVVRRRANALRDLVLSNGISVMQGRGRIQGKGKVLITPKSGTEETINAKSIVIAAGSAPIELPMLPFDETIVSSDAALSFDRVPNELIVVGGGAIGLELGSVWSRLGSKVTIVELLPLIAPGADSEAAKALGRELMKQGIEIHTDTKVSGFTKKGTMIELTLVDRDNAILKLSADKVLVAAGRRPVTENLSLDEVGIETDVRTRKISVDVGYETTAKGVFAIGDVIRGPMLAHKAEEEGIVLAELLAGKRSSMNYTAIPGVIYTWPELAWVGTTEENLVSSGVPYNKGMFFFKANGRADTSGNTAGFVKLLAHAKTDKILGAHIVGPWASDLIAEIVSVMEFGGSSEDIGRTIHSHPTLSESVKEAAMDAEGWSIHTAPKKKNR